MIHDSIIEDLDDNTQAPERALTERQYVRGGFREVDRPRNEPRVASVDPDLLRQYGAELRKWKPGEPQSELLASLIYQIGFKAATVQRHRDALAAFRSAQERLSDQEEWDRRRKAFDEAKATVMELHAERDAMNRQFVELNQKINQASAGMGTAQMALQEEMHCSAKVAQARQQLPWLIGDEAGA